MRGQKRRKPLITLTVWLIGFIWIIPLWSTLITGLKTSSEYLQQAFWELPTKLGFWDNINIAFYRASLGLGMRNSFCYGLIGAVLAVVIASLAAYSITKLKVKFRLFWFLLIFSGTIFPFQMYLIPLFTMYTATGLYDTHWGLIGFYTAIAIPFCIFVMRNYFITLPRELQEAAKLDGCSDFKMFWCIFVPVAKAPMLVLVLFQFTWIWNDLMFGLVLSRSEDVRPLMAGLVGMQGVYGGGNLPAVIAGTLMASLPTIGLFLLLQRYFIAGLNLSISGD